MRAAALPQTSWFPVPARGWLVLLGRSEAAGHLESGHAAAGRCDRRVPVTAGH
jgi:hypothetical protein